MAPLVSLSGLSVTSILVNLYLSDKCRSLNGIFCCQTDKALHLFGILHISADNEMECGQHSNICWMKCFTIQKSFSTSSDANTGRCPSPTWPDHDCNFSTMVDTHKTFPKTNPDHHQSTIMVPIKEKPSYSPPCLTDLIPELD